MAWPLNVWIVAAVSALRSDGCDAQDGGGAAEVAANNSKMHATPRANISSVERAESAGGYASANGRTGEPVTPFIFSGRQMNANS